jgi:Gly-Xaa carboxypeptidase
MPMRQGHALNGHTVDERVDMENHLEVVRFYYDLIRNFDASKAASTMEETEVGEL